MDYDYRQAVKKAIPHLKYLDDELLIEGVGSFQKHNVFDADWAYLEELQKDMSLQDDSDSLVSGVISKFSFKVVYFIVVLFSNCAYQQI